MSPRNNKEHLTPWIVCRDQNDLHVLLCNCTNQKVCLPSRFSVGMAGTLPEESKTQSVESVSAIPTVRDCSVVSEHVQPLLKDSPSELSGEQEKKLERLLIEYEDVFAKSDFDLGHFTTVYNLIGTGQEAPIKQGLRRTPLHFRGEEDEHLDKMLKAGVIQSSVCEWASPPVLLRKRDGSVRWCTCGITRFKSDL